MTARPPTGFFTRLSSQLYTLIAASSLLLACAHNPQPHPSAAQQPPANAATNNRDKQPLGSFANPVRADGPEGQREYLARLVCSNQEPVSAFQRLGSAGVGPYGSILDVFVVICDTYQGAVNHTLYMDMYHSGYRETRPALGFAALQ